MTKLTWIILKDPVRTAQQTPSQLQNQWVTDVQENNSFLLSEQLKHT